MNIARGNRKIKAYKTGQATIRRVLVDGKTGYIIIAFFEDWNKAHAINPADGRPEYDKRTGKRTGNIGKMYRSMGQAWKACNKYCPNIRLFPSVAMPLAKGDYYYSRMDDKPADMR